MKRRTVILATLVVVLLATGGYWLTTGPGRELLRVQAEQVLSGLLDGEVRIARVEPFFHDGLGLRGYDVRVYPGPDGPGMRADVATIEFREAGLLAAHFELALLEVERLTVRAVREEDGSWSFPPLQALAERPSTSKTREPVLEILDGAEVVSRFLMEEERIADRIVIRSGSLDFEDRSRAIARGSSVVQRFQVDGIDARLHRPWPSTDAALALSGTLTGPHGHPVPVVWYGWRRASHLDIVVEAQDLRLDALDAYVRLLSPKAAVAGTVTARVRLTSDTPGTQQVGFKADLANLEPTIVVDDEAVPLGMPFDRLEGQLEVTPQAARLRNTKIEGPDIDLGIAARIERPVSADALAYLDIWIDGVAVEHMDRIIAQLPRRAVEATREWFDRLESGTVDHFSIRGTAHASVWGALLQGELDHVPHDFSMKAEVSKVTARLDEDDRVTDGSFTATWTEDRIALRDGRGIWQDEELPQIDITVDRFSRLVGMKESARSSRALPIPGVRLLWDVLGGDSEPEQKPATPPRFRVEIDLVDHPILRWPVEDAHVVVTPTATGTEGQVLAATWGGQPIRAEVLYQIAPEARLTVGLEAVDTAPEPVDLQKTGGAASGTAPWGFGRFDLEPHASGDGEKAGMFTKMSGSFSLVGSDARFDDLEVALGDELTAKAQLVLQLGSDERAGVDLSGRIVDASCEALGKRLGLPAGFITGSVDVFADIDGYLARDAHPLEHLEGTIHAAAKKGEIRQSVPLAVSLATATDGFNPFAKRESLQYDTIDADLVLRDGIVTAKRFELEGPVRVYATGNLDLIDDEVDAVVGVFLLQKFRELLGKLPLVNLVLPGSKHGFVGAYFQVDGDVDDPKVSMMAMKSLQEELPDLIAKPFQLIQWVWASEDDSEESKSSRRAKKRAEAQAKQAKPGKASPAPDEPAPEKAESSALGPADTVLR